MDSKPRPAFEGGALRGGHIARPLTPAAHIGGKMSLEADFRGLRVSRLAIVRVQAWLALGFRFGLRGRGLRRWSRRGVAESELFHLRLKASSRDAEEAS